MQYALEEKIYRHRLLILLLSVTASINIVSNHFGEGVAIISDSLLFVLFPGSLVLLSIITNRRFGTTGKHGMAWILFSCFSVSWFMAEIIWIVLDLFLNIDPFPSIADIFYIAGYPFLFIFMLFYLKPVKQGISNKILVTAMSLSAVILTSSLVMIGWDVEFDSHVVSNDNANRIFDVVFSLIYPILDAIILVPSIIGVLLFLKGQVNFLWSLICLAVISVSVADAAFVIGHFDSIYYTGHYIDIFFLWPYILMSFGLKNHYSLFQSPKP